jgi:hypothetical protein
MNTTYIVFTALACGLAAASTVYAQTEPLGGQPPPGSTASIKDFDYQIKYQRTLEAVLWGMPADAIYRFRAAAFKDLGSRTTTSSPLPAVTQNQPLFGTEDSSSEQSGCGTNGACRAA